VSKKTLDSFRDAHDPQRIIARLEGELKRANEQSADAVAIKAAIGTLGESLEQLKPPQWTVAQTAHSNPGVPTLFLSDLHWGEVVRPTQIGGVNSFNMESARNRLRYTVETAIDLLRILDPKMRYPGIVVPLGGDLISGNIHDELTATNELNTMPVVLDLFEHLVSAITLLAITFKQVFLPCVSGNHGRDTRKVWAKDRTHTSFDWLLCNFLAKHFSGDKRVTFYIPDGPDALYRIYGTRYLLTHGDRLGHGGDGLIGFLGPVTRGDHKRRTRQQQIEQPYDVLLAGHWHQYVQTRRLIVNGSLKGYDEYAYTEAFPFEPPQQALWVTHPRYGITYRMPVLCEQPVKPSKSAWVTAH
jgi:predicted phosphodiesterase